MAQEQNLARLLNRIPLVSEYWLLDRLRSRFQKKLRELNEFQFILIEGPNSGYIRFDGDLKKPHYDMYQHDFRDELERRLHISSEEARNLMDISFREKSCGLAKVLDVNPDHLTFPNRIHFYTKGAINVEYPLDVILLERTLKTGLSDRFTYMISQQTLLTRAN